MTYKILLTLTLLFIAAICILGLIGVEAGLIEKWRAMTVMVALGAGSATVVWGRI